MAKSSIILQMGWKEFIAVVEFFECGTKRVTGFWSCPRSTAILFAYVAVYFSFSNFGMVGPADSSLFYK